MKATIDRLPPHLFISSCDGALYDTRKPQWSANPLRKNYCATRARIKTLADAKATLRAGGFTWPGAYPLFLVTHDNAALCFACARKEWRQIVWDHLNKASTGWRLAACEVNYEDDSLFCDHCGEQIPSAYGDDNDNE